MDDQENQTPDDPKVHGDDAGERETAPAAGPRPPRDPLASRGLRWGTATAVYIVVVLAVLVIVNMVGARFTKSFDLTANHKLTLTSDSVNILKGLTNPVQVYAFEQPGDTTGSQVKVLLSQYQAASHGLLTYQIVDPAAQPTLAAEYQVQSYGTVVVVSGSNHQSVTSADMTTYTDSGSAVFDGEGAITNAIIRAANPQQLKVDFLAGHGEPDITANTIPDAVQALKDQGYSVDSLNLLTSGTVPSDVSALIEMDPQQDLSASDVKALNDYAAAGGHLMFMLDPTTTAMPNLDALLKTWGITPQNDLAVDTSSSESGQPTYVVPTYGDSPITAPLEQAHYASVLPQAQGLTLGSAPSGYTVTPFLTTTSGTSGGKPISWGVTGLGTQRTSADYVSGTDIAGPLTLAATVVQDVAATAGSSSTSASGASSAAGSAAALGQKQFRAVVIGNATFIASDSSGQGQGPINLQGNKDLFLNSVGWLTALAQGIAVRPHAALNTQVVLTAGSAKALEAFVYGVPLLCFALAFSTWWTRRRL